MELPTVGKIRLVDDPFQFGRNITIETNRSRRVSVQYGVEDERRGFASERQRARSHFVQHRPEREQVGAGIQFLAFGLFRGHVGDGSQRRAGTGEMICVHRTRLRVERPNFARRP
jgi:hypothetical protein